MPIYGFKFEKSSNEVDISLTYDELKKLEQEDGSYEIAGKKAWRVFSSASLLRSPQWAVGHRSMAMAVDPSQAEETQKELRNVTGYKHIEVDKTTGEVVTYSQRQKVAAARAMGMIDLDGGYTS